MIPVCYVFIVFRRYSAPVRYVSILFCRYMIPVRGVSIVFCRYVIPVGYVFIVFRRYGAPVRYVSIVKSYLIMLNHISKHIQIESSYESFGCFLYFLRFILGT
jgi:hypothetical protein